MKKISIYALILMLIFTMSPAPTGVFAKDSVDDEEKVLLLADKKDEEIDVFESGEEIDSNKPSDTIADDTNALVIKEEERIELEGKSYLYVVYETDEEELDEKEGYVLEDYVIQINEADKYKEKRSESNEDEKTEDDEGTNEEDSENNESNEDEKTEDDEGTNEEGSENSESNEDEKTEDDEGTKEEVSENNESNEDEKTEDDEGTNEEGSENNESNEDEKTEDDEGTNEEGSENNESNEDEKTEDDNGTNEEDSENSESNEDEKESENDEANKDENSKNEKDNNKDLVTPFKNSASNTKSELLQGVAKKSPTNIREKTSTKSPVINTFHIGEVFEYKAYNKHWNEIKVKVNGKKETGYIHKKHMTNVKTKAQDKKGVAKKAKTNVRAGASTNAKVLKSYPIGAALKYETFSKNWNQIKVKVNGKTETGYIHNKHVTNVNTKPQDKKGVAKKTKTNVRAGASTNAKVLKSYPIGAALEYETFSKNWNQIKVKVNGKTETGYIHNKHVTNVNTKPQDKKGVAKKTKTNVRAGASTNAKVLKSYPIGAALEYETFSKNWNQIKVELNGKTETGYIHNKHVTNVNTKAQDKKGVAKKKKTNVRAGASTNSKVLKSYPIGTALEYETFSKNWNQIKVKVNGKTETGYIHNKHVTNINTKPQDKEVVASKSPTNIRAGASTKSKVIKKVSKGQLIDVKTFSKNWYTFETKVNGESTTGFVHKKHVNKDINEAQLYGFSKEKGTSVYSDTSKNSKVLKSYKKGELLEYKIHNTNWYKAVVKVNGKSTTGFIPKSDVLQSKGSVVMVDAGHGGSDSGSTANGIKEKNINLELALDLERKLKKSGFTVIMSRTTDTFVSLDKRSSKANKVNPDIFVSIHANSFNGSAKGIETYWYNGHESKESELLAHDLQNELIKNTKANDRGAKEKNLHVNRETYMPSSLVEVGFIDNKEEAKKLKKTSYKKTLVKSMFNGIKNFLKI